MSASEHGLAAGEERARVPEASTPGERGKREDKYIALRNI